MFKRIGSQRLAVQLSILVTSTSLILATVFATLGTFVAQNIAEAQARQNVESTVEGAIPLASWAAYALSKSTARQALATFKDNLWIIRAEIQDDFGRTLAEFSNDLYDQASAKPDDINRYELQVYETESSIGYLVVEASYQLKSFSIYLVATTVAGILVTSLCTSALLFYILQNKVISPINRLENYVKTIPRTLDLSEQSFGSKELDDLYSALTLSWSKTRDAIEERNMAMTDRHKVLIERATLADAVGFALEHLSGFLLTYSGGRLDARPMRLGSAIPDELQSIITKQVGLSDRSFFTETKLQDGRIFGISGVDIGQDQFAVFGQDITKTYELRREAEAAQRLDSIGVLTSGVAHDFNNVLAIIIGYLEIELLQSEQNQNLQSAMDAAKRGSRLSQRLLNLSRKEARSSVQIDLNKMMESLKSQVPSLLGNDLQFVTEVQPNLGVIAESEFELESVLINMIVNAKDANPRDNKILLQTHHATQSEIKRNELDKSQDYLCIRITDKGEGMSAEIVSRIMEPFYTTKPRNKGTGLGLALANAFVSRSKGKLSITSERGKGTSVSIYLPSANKDFHTQISTSAKGHERRLEGLDVLIVEDEPDLLRILRAQLSDAGANVDVAQTYLEAKEMLTQHLETPYDILLTDVVLPDGSGIELIDLLDGKTEIDTKIILTSGNLDTRMLSASQSARLSSFIPKPLAREDLLSAIMECT